MTIKSWIFKQILLNTIDIVLTIMGLYGYIHYFWMWPIFVNVLFGILLSLLFIFTIMNIVLVIWLTTTAIGRESLEKQHGIKFKTLEE